MPLSTMRITCSGTPRSSVSMSWIFWISSCSPGPHHRHHPPVGRKGEGGRDHAGDDFADDDVLVVQPAGAGEGDVELGVVGVVSGVGHGDVAGGLVAVEEVLVDEVRGVDRAASKAFLLPLSSSHSEGKWWPHRRGRRCR